MGTFLNPYLNRPQLRWQKRQSGLFSLLVVGLFWSCTSGSSTDLEHHQANNLRLAKALHTHLNRRDWPAVSGLCAKTVRYRGRITQFTDVEEPRAQFLTHYRATLYTDRPGQLEIRQMYPAGSYHIIVEGLVTGQPPDTVRPVCLIYTIEDDHITRLYAY